jgi:hypothetical protein
MYGFPVSLDDGAIKSLSKTDFIGLAHRIHKFLDAVHKGQSSAAQMQDRNQAFQKWNSDYVKPRERPRFGSTTITTKDLLIRFSALAPEERTFVHRYVFEMDVPSDLAKWYFYMRWADVEKARDTKRTDDYAQYVDNFRKALAIFE